MHPRLALPLVLLFPVVGCPAVHAQGSAATPNVLLVMVDDLGYGDVGCFGADDMRTPHIDGLAASGMTWTRFYANCPVCSPTRAALLSGRYPDEAGVPGVVRTHAENNWGYLDPGTVLLPRLMQGAGYETALVGKWHLGLEAPNIPTERAFDHFHGFLGDMMDDYVTHLRHDVNYMRLGTAAVEPQGHATDLFSDWACDWLAERKSGGSPFFLYLAYNAPHTPIQPPADWLAKVRQREPQTSEKRAKLVALIEHLDDGVGRVLAKLGELGMREDTLVVFTSDNGGQSGVGASNGGLRGGKGDMYEGGLRVPTVFSWPGRIEAGSTTDAPAMTVDLFATLLGVAGTAAPSDADGVSLVPWLLAGDTPVAELPVRPPMYWVRREGGRGYFGLCSYAVRDGDWKLVQNRPGEPFRLFDLAADPGERIDLAAERPERLRDLLGQLALQKQRAGGVPWQRPEKAVAVPK